MKAARETWIDYARGIAIILVLYRHVFEGIKSAAQQNVQLQKSINDYIFLEHINIMFFSFRMPLFFLISGIFVSLSLQKRGLKDFIATKGRTILYPYFLWGFFQITLQLLFSQFVNNPPRIYDYLYLLYLPREIEQFWYLYALFNVSVLYAFVKVKLRINTLQNIGLGLLFFYISAVLHQRNIHIWFIGDILHYYLFYAIGSGLCSYLRNPVNLKILQSWKVLLFLLLPFIATQLYFLWANLNYADQKYEFVEFFQPLNFLIISLCGCIFIIHLSYVLQKYQLANWLHKLGSYSLYIYVAHVIVLAATRAFMTRLFYIYDVPWLLLSGIVTGLVIPIILYKAAVRLNLRWLFSLERREALSRKA